MNHLNLLLGPGYLRCLELLQVADVLLLVVFDSGVVKGIKARLHRSKLIIGWLTERLGERLATLSTIPELGYVPLIINSSEKWHTLLFFKAGDAHGNISHLC